jgi:hypothetical protein
MLSTLDALQSETARETYASQLLVVLLMNVRSNELVVRAQ